MSGQTVRLHTSHKKEEFRCGKISLDKYLHNQASQDFKRQLSVCFVLADEGGTVKGYYTLSNDSISSQLIPDDVRKKMPPAYNNLPVTLLGRLAVDSRFAGQRLGEFLLIDALKKSYETSLTSIGSMAVVVDPLDIDAKRFYSKYGFISLPDSERMFLPMKTISKLFP